MAAETSILIITWGAIVLLAFGLAGCLRAIRTLSIQIDDRSQSPRRLQVGDALTVPPAIAAAAAGNRFVALLFATASCTVCRAAIDALRPVVGDLPDIALQVLWADERPPGYEDVGLAHQADVFRTLRVPVTPVLVLVDLEDSTVAARGLLGAPDEVRAAQDALRQVSATRRGRADGATPDASPQRAAAAQATADAGAREVQR